MSGPATTLIQQVRRIALTPSDFLLVREKQLPAAALTLLCRRLRTATPARVLVSGRPDIALAAGLDGVHLASGPGELTPAQVRALGKNSSGLWVSLSCHSLADVERAHAAGASAVLFGPVFGKIIDGKEVTPAAGLVALAAACRVGVPVFALGSVTARNAPACLQAGAAGIAGIRLFFGSL